MNRSLKFACATALAAPAILLACGSGGNHDPAAECPTLVIPDSCPVAQADAGPDASPPPSWKKDVEPLFAKYCDTCHTNGGPGQSTKDFSTFEGIQNAAPTIGMQVDYCLMPQPGNAQPTPGERETIITWALVCRAPNN